MYWENPLGCQEDGFSPRRLLGLEGPFLDVLKPARSEGGIAACAQGSPAD